MAGSQNIGESSDNPVAINVTAMVDVIFCLCIFFMCSFKFKQLEGRIDTWLPKDKGINAQPSDVVIKDEVRVVVMWNEATGEVERFVRGNAPAASDDELVTQITTLAAEYNAKSATPDWPLIIQAQDQVHWLEIVQIMDLCKGNDIERIEFGAAETVIENN